MRAQQLLTSDLPLLLPIDTVANAIELMDEYKVSHLPLVVEDMFKGLINEEDLKWFNENVHELLGSKFSIRASWATSYEDLFVKKTIMFSDVLNL